MPAHANYLPDWARRTLRTALQAFVGVFALSLFGWLGAVQEWAACTDACAAFPDVSPLGKAAIAAAAAAAVAAVTGVQNYLEDRTAMPALLKSRGGASSDAGHVDWVGLVVVLIAFLILLAVLGVI